MPPSRAAPLVILLASCARAPRPARPPPAPPASAARDAPSCLPLVSGCGCAYACAASVRALDGGVHEVAHARQDGRLDRATVERWCFDVDGRGGPASHAAASQTRCLDVFFDGTPCGGECIPRADLLTCASRDGRCVAEGGRVAARP